MHCICTCTHQPCMDELTAGCPSFSDLIAAPVYADLDLCIARSHHVQQVGGTFAPMHLPPVACAGGNSELQTPFVCSMPCAQCASQRFCSRRYVLAFSGFPFPVSLTLWHMLFCSVVSAALVKGGLVDPVEGMTFEIYKVHPPGPADANPQLVHQLLHPLHLATNMSWVVADGEVLTVPLLSLRRLPSCQLAQHLQWCCGWATPRICTSRSRSFRC